MQDASDIPSTYEGLTQILKRLRDPQSGCPWDREQTHESLRPSLLEESYEALQAIDRGDVQGLAEELGDLLLQVAFHIQVAQEEGVFSQDDVFGKINGKLVRRHPHVFGNRTADSARAVEVQWEEIKKAEREEKQQRESLLDGVPKVMPALGYSQALQERASRVGFDWNHVEEVRAKVGEEREELDNAQSAEEREAEFGDLLFAVVNLGRWLKVDAESALRTASDRFYRRFYVMERLAGEHKRSLEGMSLEEKEALWERAKRETGHRASSPPSP